MKYKVTKEDRENMPDLTDKEIKDMMEYAAEYSAGKHGCLYCGYPFSAQEYKEAGNCSPQCPEE